jgi:hypothetical protein
MNKIISARLTFSDLNAYHKVDYILYMNGFKQPTSPESGNGYYKIDDNWMTIEFDTKYENNILPLINDINFKLDYRTPPEYKIFNQGGYLD